VGRGVRGEVECRRQRVHDLWGQVAVDALFQPRQVLDGDAGEPREFVSAQSGHSAPAVGGEAHLARLHAGPARLEELSENEAMKTWFISGASARALAASVRSNAGSGCCEYPASTGTIARERLGLFKATVMGRHPTANPDARRLPVGRKQGPTPGQESGP
jgi:hypothetical protein